MDKTRLLACSFALSLLATACTAASADSRGAAGGQLSGTLASAEVESSLDVGDEVIAAQREALANETEGQGYGPQSPRDINRRRGENERIFSKAPRSRKMNLCNIHFHENAEHRGGQFTTYAGNGDGHGYGTGYKYNGRLSRLDLAPLEKGPIADNGHGGLEPGDTIEVHYVYTTAQVEPGPTLGACLSESIGNPQLRVEAQVFVLVNNDKAADFVELAEVDEVNGYFQAINIPSNTGRPFQYEGSTTGPTYNEKGSPFQVSWSVRPRVLRVDIDTVESWLEDNVFDEDHAHAVRNLVVNPDLLSKVGGRESSDD